MKNLKNSIAALLIAFTCSVSAQKDIVDTAAGVESLSTLVAAVKAGDLVETLKSKGPFTVFAPGNAAFEKLPEGTVPTLLKPENKKMLQGILTYHVVAGKVMASDLLAAIKKNDGKFKIKTVQGGTLVAHVVDGKPTLTDEKGNSAIITATDVDTSNGVVHLIDSVVMPK